MWGVIEFMEHNYERLFIYFELESLKRIVPYVLIQSLWRANSILVGGITENFTVYNSSILPANKVYEINTVKINNMTICKLTLVLRNNLLLLLYKKVLIVIMSSLYLFQIIYKIMNMKNTYCFKFVFFIINT